MHAFEFRQLLADDTNAEDLPPGTAQRERTNYERALQCSEELFLLDTIFAAALAPPPYRRIERCMCISIEHVDVQTSSAAVVGLCERVS